LKVNGRSYSCRLTGEICNYIDYNKSEMARLIRENTNNPSAANMIQSSTYGFGLGNCMDFEPYDDQSELSINGGRVIIHLQVGDFRAW
jgi:hypothetical protein